MKKKYLAALLAISLTLSALPQGQIFAATSAEKQAEALEAPPTMSGEIAKLTKKNWIYLTKQQKLADLEYLHQVLQENYPYFQVAKRMLGVDLEEKYQQAKRAVENSNSDLDFYLALSNYTGSVNQLGHLALFNPYWYEETAEGYQEVAAFYQEDERIQKIAAAYNNEKSAANYKKMEVIMKPAYDTVMAYQEALQKTENGQEEKTDTSNVETKIIEKGKIAYIKINSFPSTDAYEEDKKLLFSFYERVKDYDHVIFDLTDNGGGAMSYFDDLLAAPNTDKILTADIYGLIKAGENNQTFLDFSEYETTASFPKLPKMNPEDLAELDLYTIGQYQIEPLSDKKLLQGKLWMLVSENVFSSSEYAAMFSKTTGFMTLVGTETGGDGIGSDPLPIVMPNSGLIVRYSPIYGATPDGASSQEVGTIPDIVSQEGESALDTCLKAIAQEEK